MHDSKRNRERRIANMRESYHESLRRKRLLANSILLKIIEIESNFPVHSFTYPLENLGRLERFVLSRYPEDISDKISHPTFLKIDYNDSCEPPQLTVYMREPETENTPE